MGISGMTDPSIGALSSRVQAAYEVSPAPGVLKRQDYLAVNVRLGESTINFGAGPTIAPIIGAGMWLRRDAFLENIPWRQPETLLADRTGTSLTSGGDSEFGFLLGRAGFSRVYEPHVRIAHLIPKSRVQSRYFFRLIVGNIRSDFTLRKKYLNYQHTFLRQLYELLKVILTIIQFLAAPFQPDGFRERFFILAGRWAQFKGPF